MRNVFLNEEQIKEITKLQLDLDSRIVEQHGLQDQDLTLEKYIALKTEVFEFVNEIESFKFWKTKKGKENKVEEACDALHFIVSLAIDFDVDLKCQELKDYNAEDYDMNELLGVLDSLITDAYVNREWDLLCGALTLICIALDIEGYNADDLYDAYIKKNMKNHTRQDNKY